MTDAEWNALSPDARSKLIEKQKAENASKGTAAGKTANHWKTRKLMVIVPWDLLKACQIYRRTIKDLSNN